MISAAVLIFLALPVAGLIGYCTNCIADYRYESADGSCNEYTENTYSEGGLDYCVNRVDNEACSACDITNGFCTNGAAGHEYNAGAKCYNCYDIGISSFSCDSTNGYCTDCYPGHRYNPTDGRCYGRSENTLSTGGKNDEYDNCVSGNTCSACDITNGFCTNGTAGHEFNPDTGKCTPCPDYTYSEGGSKAKCINCNGIGSSCYSCDRTNGYCNKCYAGYKYNPADGRFNECEENTFSTGHKNEVCYNCTDETCSECDKTNRFLQIVQQIMKIVQVNVLHAQ